MRFPPTPSAAGRLVLLGWPMAQLPPEPTMTDLYKLASSHFRLQQVVLKQHLC